MRMIKWAHKIMKNNLGEARAYIEKAYSLKDTNKMAADWCKEMATAHLAFNVNGHAVAKALIEQAKESAEHPEYIPGMMVYWNDEHAEMMQETAEIDAMIKAYK